MGWIQNAIVRKISSLLGADVTIGNLEVSLLGGAIEVQDLAVGARHPLGEILRVARVRLKVSVARALKKEIAVESLTIDSPSLRLVRATDGSTNIPTSWTARRVSDSPSAAQTQEADQTARPWSLECEKVLLTGGSAQGHLQDLGAHWSASDIVGELHRSAQGYEVTAAGRVVRENPSLDVGELRITGRCPGATNLAQVLTSAISAELSLGSLLKAQADTPGFVSGAGTARVYGAADAATIFALLPPGLQLPAWTKRVAGNLEFSLEIARDPSGALKIPQIIVRAADVVLTKPRQE